MGVMPHNHRGHIGRAAETGSLLFALGVCLALTACAVGPAYQQPETPAVQHYTAQPEPAKAVGTSASNGSAAGEQTFVIGAKIKSRWWESFGSDALNALVAQALENNPDLARAKATLERAQYQLKAVKGAFFPHISLDLGARRTRSPGANAGGNFPSQLFSVYTGQVSVSYLPDVFGLNRLVMRDQQAQVDVVQSRLAAAKLSVIGNVVTTTLNLAALNAQVAAIHRTVEDQEKVLGFARTRYQLGAASQFDVLAQQSQLASSQARLTQLQQSHDKVLHLLATYLGEFPSQANGLAIPELASLHLPAVLPVSLPSTLVQNRPDVRAAEAQLRAANAKVGEAVARMYPRIQLTADYGRGSNSIGSFFNFSNRLWDLAAGLTLPLFEGGTLRAQKHAAQAGYRAVLASYKKTVLESFRSVADVLRALQHDAATLDARARAMSSAQQALRLAETQYKTGDIDYASLLSSQTQVEQARVALVQSRAQRFADTAGLYIAFGGAQWANADEQQADRLTPAASAADVGGNKQQE